MPRKSAYPQVVESISKLSESDAAKAFVYIAGHHPSMALEALNHVHAEQAAANPTLILVGYGPVDESIKVHLRTFLMNNEPIQAIKELRARTGAGLKEAKDYVEAYREVLRKGGGYP